MVYDMSSRKLTIGNWHLAKADLRVPPPGSYKGFLVLCSPHSNLEEEPDSGAVLRPPIRP